MHLARISLTELREPEHVARAVISPEGIEELAESIRRVGLIQPIVVEEREGFYEVVAGHRRLLACRRLGLAAVSCLVRGSKDAELSAVKLHENLYRQELTPVEEAAFFAELLKMVDNDTDKLAALVHQKREYVEGRLNLLMGDPEILQAVASKGISLGVAQELNKIPEERDRRYYLHWAITAGATVATARQWRCIAEAQSAGRALGEGAPMPASAMAPAVSSGPTCAACDEAEPLSDVEFRYLHRSCRRRLENVLRKLGLDPAAPLVVQLEMFAAWVEKSEREAAAVERK